jgi:nicotinate phosphoribosyltransferase
MTKGLILDLYELTMAQVYFKHKAQATATFDLFIRSQARPFYVACGIDEAILAIKEFKFSPQDLNYLRELALFEDEFLDYLKEFRFNGEIWGVEEPEIIFAREPILRISAKLIEAQILESIVLNKVNLGTTLASKAAMVMLAAKGRDVYDFSLRRTQGVEASLASAKYSYIAGAKGTSNVYAGFLYRIPVAGTMAHSFVMSFNREVESFYRFAQAFPAKSIFLVDTYNVKGGIRSAIRVAKLLRKQGVTISGIRLDSGNLSADSCYARSLMDENELIDATIIASGNLDESKIKQLVDKKSPIDAFGVGTNMGCSVDLPYTDVIYKLVEIKDENSAFTPVMKLSESKSTLPAKKQIFRIFNKKNIMQKDIICLQDEQINGKKLLRRMMAEGCLTYAEKTINEKREIFTEKIKTLPSQLQQFVSGNVYPIEISRKLKALSKDLKEKIQKKTRAKAVFFDIDTQHDFIDKKELRHAKDARDLKRNVRKITGYARKNGFLILSSQSVRPKERLILNRGFVSQKKIYSSQELQGICSRYAQLTIESSLDIFSNPNTERLLEVIFPDIIYIYGTMAQRGVKEAVEEILKYGFCVTIIEDAVKEIFAGENKELFSVWKKKGVKFITIDKLIKEGGQCS